MQTFHRTFRFDHPDFDPSARGPGLQLSASGTLEMVEEEASIRQAILLLLSTVPGERVMRPSYGCDLYKLVFAPNDDTTAGLAAHTVRRTLEQWEPRILLIDVDAERSPVAPERLEVRVEYRVRRSGRIGTVTYEFDLAGGSG